MSIDKPTEKLNQQQRPWPTDEEVGKSIENDLHSKKLTKINNVLQILDFPENKEDTYKNLLEKEDNQTLEDLATKSKKEIISFLISKNNQNTTVINQKQRVDYENLTEQQKENNKTYQNLKNILPTSVFENNKAEFQNLKDLFFEYEALQNEGNIKEQTEIVKAIIEQLKSDIQLLPAIVKELGWADKNNPKYTEFRNTLIGINSSFLPLLNDLEKFEIGNTFNTNEIVEWIEKNSWGMIEIDLKGSEAMSKRSLIGSEYSIDKAIDTKALNEVMGEGQKELANLKDNFATLQEFGSLFDELRDGLKKIWWKPDFKENLVLLTQNFSKDVFEDLNETYENMGIESDKQLKEYDITSFTDINDPWDLEPKMKNVFEKVEHLQQEIESNEGTLVQKYEADIKKLLESTSEEEEKQLETLKFLRASGFDLLPKWISDRVIRELKSNILTIPWLDLAKENIDLRNGNFGESGAFIDKEAGLNSGAKTNIVKFINKVISGDVNEPLNVEAIVNGTIVADPRFVHSQLMGATIKWRASWNYGKVVENLRK